MNQIPLNKSINLKITLVPNAQGGYDTSYTLPKSAPAKLLCKALIEVSNVISKMATNTVINRGFVVLDRRANSTLLNLTIGQAFKEGKM